MTEGAESGKYYDWTRGQTIDVERDGCRLDEWAERGDRCSFAVDASGVRVFLPAELLDDSDEYREEDPYAVAENLEQSFQRRRVDATLELLDAAVASLGTEIRILDLACGEGHITARIRDHLPDAEVSGLDYSISAIRRAQSRHAGIDFSVADAYQPPYAPEYFGAVVLNNIWEHVPDPLRLLASVRRVLAPGGFVVMSTPSRYRLGNLVRVALGRPIQFMSSAHVTEYSVGQVDEQFAFGGFDLVRTYSEPLPSGEGGLAQRLVRSTVAPVLRTLLRAVGSHHSLEATVFYLARSRPAGPAANSASSISTGSG